MYICKDLLIVDRTTPLFQYVGFFFCLNWVTKFWCIFSSALFIFVLCCDYRFVLLLVVCCWIDSLIIYSHCYLLRIFVHVGFDKWYEFTTIGFYNLFLLLIEITAKRTLGREIVVGKVEPNRHTIYYESSQYTCS